MGNYPCCLRTGSRCGPLVRVRRTPENHFGNVCARELGAGGRERGDELVDRDEIDRVKREMAAIFDAQSNALAVGTLLDGDRRRRAVTLRSAEDAPDHVT